VGLLSESETKDERRCTMLDSEVKVIEKPSSSSMPTLTETPNEGEMPIEVVLAILYTQAKRLEKDISAQVMTGRTPKGEPVTYIRMTGVIIDKDKGFVLATVGNEA
jgi:hypothetical protein